MIRYQYAADLNAVYCHPRAEHAAQDVLQLFRKLNRDKKIKPDFIEIVDLSDINKFQIPSEQGRSLTQFHSELRAGKNVKATIFVVRTDLQFGIARMMQTLHEIEDSEYAVYVVRSEDEARNKVLELRAGINAPG